MTDVAPYAAVQISQYEYDYQSGAGRKRHFVCALILDCRAGKHRAILRSIEREVKRHETLEAVQKDVARRAEEIAAWYRVTLR